MDRVLTLAAIGEAVTGLLLLLIPGLVCAYLLGSDVTGSGVVVARITGMALIGLALACLPGPASLGMLAYGAFITIYLAWLGATQTATGPLLWPAVALHAVLTAGLAINFRQRRRTDAGT
ncbi:hypothetical protein [Paracoccus litorisediminis]|uniref:Uncharacterized protein n=1 Tax=Paracoccus litorisediminis TaxID=2006130 RepID=A0A844HQU3_9RHOB|nr:hypothetical protein [Paracoccus litorisediminis]MTH61529.1 hypothetical protein [Paracoccus litorisediminis]